MKPAYQIDLRDPERALAALLDLINRDRARSYAASTWIPQPQDATLSAVSYLPITFPYDESLSTVRSARLIPSEDYRIARYGDSLKMGVGFRTSDRFELIGREWDSRKHALSVGTPFDLVTDEQPLRSGMSLVVRVTRSGWPSTWPTNASIETTIGYDPGA